MDADFYLGWTVVCLAILTALSFMAAWRWKKLAREGIGVLKEALPHLVNAVLQREELENLRKTLDEKTKQYAEENVALRKGFEMQQSEAMLTQLKVDEQYWSKEVEKLKCEIREYDREVQRLRKEVAHWKHVGWDDAAKAVVKQMSDEVKVGGLEGADPLAKESKQ